MLISDSMSLLWLSYAVLSLLVLLAGYLALGFLPRLPRLVITWTVAGLMWAPAHYTLPLLEQDENYQGMAPAAVVAGLSFLEGDRSDFAAALFVLTITAAAGAAAGLLLWRLGRGRAEARRQAKAKANSSNSDSANDEQSVPSSHGVSRQEPSRRDEPPMAAVPGDRPRPDGVAKAGQRGAVRREPTVG